MNIPSLHTQMRIYAHIYWLKLQSFSQLLMPLAKMTVNMQGNLGEKDKCEYATEVGACQGWGKLPYMNMFSL